MPIDSLAKLLGHQGLQTTQRYIDGVNPMVRQDFLRAMQTLDERSPPPATTPEMAPPSPKTPLSPINSGVERPNPTQIMEELADRGTDLPAWLRDEIDGFVRRRISGWAAHRARENARNYFNGLCKIGRWLVQQRGWQQLDQLQRSDLVAYLHQRQADGLQRNSIKSELILFRSFWRDLLASELVHNGSLLQIKLDIPQDDPLPRYLPGDQWQQLIAVVEAETARNRYRDHLNRVWFYLAAHGGLRISEITNLRLSDCDFISRRLRICSGKGNRDRVIPMTPRLSAVLQDYLVVRETAATDHLLIYHTKPLCKKIIYWWIRRYGEKANIERMTPHRLRHTLATLLVNNGMKITSLQKFLGHQDINNTLIYARVYDETVRRQFAQAMSQIEAILVDNEGSQIFAPDQPLIQEIVV